MHLHFNDENLIAKALNPVSGVHLRKPACYNAGMPKHLHAS